MTELLYASGPIAGDFTNPTNANGNTPATWAGDVNVNTSPTERWAIANPALPLTPSATQTIRVPARKGSNSGSPTVTVNLYENGSFVAELVAATTITSTTGQNLSGTFNSSAITNPANVEIEIVVVGAGGSPGARNSAQISLIEWTADTSAAAPSGGSTASVTASPDGAGTSGRIGAADAATVATASGAGSSERTGGSTATVSVTADGAGTGGAAPEGGSTATVTVTAAGSGVTARAGSSETTVTVTGEGAGTGSSTPRGGSTAAVTVTTEGAGASARADGSTAIVTVTATGGGSRENTGSSESVVSITATGQGVNPDAAGAPDGEDTMTAMPPGGELSTVGPAGTLAAVEQDNALTAIEEVYSAP